MTNKRVLVPMDGTKNAEASLGYIDKMCDPGDEIVLLSVKRPLQPVRTGFRPGAIVTAVGVGSASTPDLPAYSETTDQDFQEELDASRVYLEVLAAGLRRSGYEVTTELMIDENPEKAIIQYARIHKPTFIAMLRRTHRGLGEILFGSIASGVVHADVAPVLFLPPAPVLHDA